MREIMLFKLHEHLPTVPIFPSQVFSATSENLDPFESLFVEMP